MTTTARVVYWEHRDASNASFRTTNVNATQNQVAELDPAGSDSGIANPYLIDPNPPSDAGDSLLPYGSFGSPQQQGVTYSRDNIPVPRDYMMGIMRGQKPRGQACDSAIFKKSQLGFCFAALVSDISRVTFIAYRLQGSF